MLPLNPEKPSPSAGWFWLAVPMPANGLRLLFELGAAEKLKDEAPPPPPAPPPKENAEDVPFVGWLAPGKLWDWPKLKPFVGIAGDSGVEEFVLLLKVLNEAKGCGCGAGEVEAGVFGRRLRTSLILSIHQ